MMQEQYWPKWHWGENKGFDVKVQTEGWCLKTTAQKNPKKRKEKQEGKLDQGTEGKWIQNYLGTNRRKG